MSSGFALSLRVSVCVSAAKGLDCRGMELGDSHWADGGIRGQRINRHGVARWSFRMCRHTQWPQLPEAWLCDITRMQEDLLFR